MIDRKAIGVDPTERLDTDPLTRSIAAAHDRAQAILTGSGDGAMDAVVWLSAHLAAMEHVVYPVMADLLTEQRADLARLRPLTRRMLRGLRTLEQRHAGDGQMAGRSVEELHERLLTTMDAHVALECALLTRLVAALGDDATVGLARRYEAAVGRGPTRPHPHGPHRGRLGGIAYALDALRDHVLDVLDSRNLPLPKDEPAQREVGRWGRYLLGGVDPDSMPRAADPEQATDPRHEGDGNDD